VPNQTVRTRSVGEDHTVCARVVLGTASAVLVVAVYVSVARGVRTADTPGAGVASRAVFEPGVDDVESTSVRKASFVRQLSLSRRVWTLVARSTARMAVSLRLAGDDPDPLRSRPVGVVRTLSLVPHRFIIARDVLMTAGARLVVSIFSTAAVLVDAAVARHTGRGRSRWSRRSCGPGRRSCRPWCRRCRCRCRRTCRRRWCAVVACLRVGGAVSLSGTGDVPVELNAAVARTWSTQPGVVVLAGHVDVARLARLVVTVRTEPTRVRGFRDTRQGSRTQGRWHNGTQYRRVAVARGALILARADVARRCRPDEKTSEVASCARSIGVDESVGTRVVERASLARLVVAVRQIET